MLEFLEPALAKDIFKNVSNHTSITVRSFVLGSTANDNFDRLIVNIHQQMEEEVNRYVR